MMAFQLCRMNSKSMLCRLELHQRRSLPHGWCRHIRTGFFPEDADFLDPEVPLFAERIGSRWRYMDDASLQAPVLERSNVGMGMLVLNRPEGLDLPAINTAYTRLRNLEVNTLKRFVGLTSREPGPFCNGIHPRELLLAAAATHSPRYEGRLPSFSRALLWHNQELAQLVADYRKPIVSYLSGSATNSGAALACLASFSGAFDASEISVDSCSMGLVPDGGMTFVLGRLQWHLGEYLALTGRKIRGADLIYCQLVKHWLSPEALPFLELTSEKMLEVSETDARALLDEHSLPVPEEAFQDPFGDSVSHSNLPLIDQAFAAESIPGIVKELEIMKGSKDNVESKFAHDCLQRIKSWCPLALHATLRLIRDARKQHEKQMKQIGTPVWQYGENGNLARALRLEMRVQRRLLQKENAARGLYAKCVGIAPGSWPGATLNTVVKHDIDDLLKPETMDGDDSRLEPEDCLGDDDFSICPRSEFTLSQHPRLRRYHPDYNPITKTDHDPVWMAAEARRWSPDFLVDQRRDTIEHLLDGQDLALFGESRWVRAPQRL